MKNKNRSMDFGFIYFHSNREKLGKKFAEYLLTYRLQVLGCFSFEKVKPK